MTQINTTEVNKLDFYFGRARTLLYLFLLTFLNKKATIRKSLLDNL